MVEITTKTVDRIPFSESYVELRATVSAMVRVNESDIDNDGLVIDRAANQCYKLLLDEMNGYKVVEKGGIYGNAS